MTRRKALRRVQGRANGKEEGGHSGHARPGRSSAQGQKWSSRRRQTGSRRHRARRNRQNPSQSRNGKSRNQSLRLSWNKKSRNQSPSRHPNHDQSPSRRNLRWQRQKRALGRKGASKRWERAGATCRTGRYRAARQHYQRALLIYEALDDRSGIAESKIRVGHCRPVPG